MLERQSAEVKILALLKVAVGAVSGAELSRQLGMSRSAVWKHIEALRRSGYLIEAKPRVGYTLTLKPGQFGAVELLTSTETDFIGSKVVFFDSVDSTNTTALQYARGNAAEGTVVVAESQKSGRGRVGRTWVSPGLVNLYTSVILRPDMPPLHAHMFTFLASVVLAEVIEKVIKRRPTVKWPNDILVDGRKIAGILLEMDSETDRVHSVVIGIGVNINMTADLFPRELRSVSTSVCIENRQEYPRVEFAAALYYALEKWYKIVSGLGFGLDAFAPVLSAWKSYFSYEGRMLTVSSFNDTAEGICAGIDPDGALLLRLKTGELKRIISGDVQLCREKAEAGSLE